MKTIKKVKLKLSKEKAEKTKVYKDGKATYDPVYAGISFDANEKTGPGFALVHDGTKAFAIIEGSEGSVTTSIHDIEEFTTRQGVLDRITDLGLKYTVEPAVEPIVKKVDDVLAMEK